MEQKPILILIILVAHCSIGLSQVSVGKKYLIPANFPSDCIVTVGCPSCETPDSMIFYPDRTFLFKLGGVEGRQKHYELGIWRVEDKLIIMDIYKKLGIRPIGKPINPDYRYASNPDDYYIYEEYVPYEEWVFKTRTLKRPEWIDYSYISLDTCHKASSIEIDLREYSANGVFKIASCRQLNDDDLASLTKEDLRLMRNEIFARYGYEFKSEDLKEHFEKMSWYFGNRSNVDDFLSLIERRNIRLIQEFEQK